jgi:uncharacterized SAM-binding protein YcdF (DUF218 family)
MAGGCRSPGTRRGGGSTRRSSTLPFRAIEAAEVYRQGLAHEVWLTQGADTLEESTLEQLGIEETPEHAYSRQVLEHLGVRPESIRLLAHHSNTADEIRTVARQLKTSGGAVVILVTSKYHARRVKVLWKNLIGNSPAAIVHYASGDPSKPERWWRGTGDAMAVSREMFGLMNAWMGFPVKSEAW